MEGNPRIARVIRILTYLGLLILVLNILEHSFFGVNPHSEKYIRCDSEIGDPPCSDSLELCFAKNDTLELSPYECTSLVLYVDTFPIPNQECDYEELIEFWENYIDTFLQNRVDSPGYVVPGTDPVVGSGELRECLCNRPIFIYENDALRYFDMETVSAGASADSGLEQLGGTISPNYILKAEGNVPAQIRELVSHNKPCFEGGQFDGSREHPISDMSIDISLNNEGDRVEDRSFLENAWHFLYKHYYCPEYRSCLKSLEPFGASSNKKTIAILDTGLDLLLMDEGVIFYEPLNVHPCLQTDVIGWNFVNNSPDYDDKCGHGSTVALSYLNGLKKLNFDLSKQQILPVQVLNECGRGTLFDVTCGVYYAIDKNADVINMSLGAYLESSDILAKAIFEAAELDIAVITSAGNDSIALRENYFLDKDTQDTVFRRHLPSNYNGLSQHNDSSTIFELGATCGNPERLGKDDSKPWIFTNHRDTFGVFGEGGIHFELLFSDFMDISDIKSIAGTSFATPTFSAAVVNEYSRSSNQKIDIKYMRERSKTYINKNRKIKIVSYFQRNR